MPFDQVKVEGEVVSVDDFLALPLFKRVRFVLAGNLEFLSSGQPVDQSDALRALRARAA